VRITEFDDSAAEKREETVTVLPLGNNARMDNVQLGLVTTNNPEDNNNHHHHHHHPLYRTKDGVHNGHVTSAWAYAWQLTAASIAQNIRIVRKSCARRTGRHGFFSKKKRNKVLRNTLEEDALSRLVGGIEAGVRPRWLRAVNRAITERVTPRLNRRMGHIFSIDSIEMHLGSVACPLDLDELHCSSTPRSANITVHEDEDPSHLVRINVEFTYVNTLALKVRGCYHATESLPWILRGVARRVAAKRRNSRQADSASSAASSETTARSEEDKGGGGEDQADPSSEPEEGLLGGLMVGGHFVGPIQLELDMYPTTEASYPLLRHIRISQLPRMVLKQQFVLLDGPSVLKLVPKKLLIKLLEGSINSQLSRFLENKKGFACLMRPRPEGRDANLDTYMAHHNVNQAAAEPEEEEEEAEDSNLDESWKSTAAALVASTAEKGRGTATAMLKSTATAMLKREKAALNYAKAKGKKGVTSARTHLQSFLKPKPLFHQSDVYMTSASNSASSHSGNKAETKNIPSHSDGGIAVDDDDDDAGAINDDRASAHMINDPRISDKLDGSRASGPRDSPETTLRAVEDEDNSVGDEADGYGDDSDGYWEEPIGVDVGDDQ